jgi:acetoacetyl-CoA synthetase
MIKENPPIWQPSAERIANAEITAFITRLKRGVAPSLPGYAELYDYSLADPEKFWRAIWDHFGVKGDPGAIVVRDLDRMPGAQWFPDGRLNLAENMMWRRDDGEAIVEINEEVTARRISFAQLYAEVSRLVTALRAAGIMPGDRVAAILPNRAEAVIAMLATTAIGAVWCVCSPEFGVPAILDRLAQVTPRVLLGANGYRYDGRWFDLRPKLAEVAERLPGLEHRIMAGRETLPSDNWVSWETFLAAYEPGEIDFPRFAFDHPAFILYSSGTTGLPKGIVHGAGGALIENLKDLGLHFDVRPGDRIFWWTTTGWVVWTMLTFGLARGATLVLYDGGPFQPTVAKLFDIAAAERVTFLRLTPALIEAYSKAGLQPAESHDLSSLRCITSGGSPLGPEGYRFVYSHVKSDVQLAAPAGGTDPLGALVTGNPITAVWPGEIQCRGLGLAVEVFDDGGRPLIGQPGELVVTKPFPSMPVALWNDPTGERYRETYFGTYSGVWRQGDWAMITRRGGVVIFGRSDSTLKVRGIRIGTAEIYRALQRHPEIIDSVAVELSTDTGAEIILCIQLKLGLRLDDDVIARIRSGLRDGLSPRHVPDRIYQVLDIPRTVTGKVSEAAVRSAVNSEPVANFGALANPESLAYFATIGRQRLAKIEK